MLAIKSEANSTNVGMVVKMALCFLLIIVMYEVPGVFKTLFRYVYISPSLERLVSCATHHIHPHLGGPSAVVPGFVPAQRPACKAQR